MILTEMGEISPEESFELDHPTGSRAVLVAERIACQMDLILGRHPAITAELEEPPPRPKRTILKSRIPKSMAELLNEEIPVPSGPMTLNDRLGLITRIKKSRKTFPGYRVLEFAMKVLPLHPHHVVDAINSIESYRSERRRFTYADIRLVRNTLTFEEEFNTGLRHYALRVNLEISRPVAGEWAFFDRKGLNRLVEGLGDHAATVGNHKVYPRNIFYVSLHRQEKTLDIYGGCWSPVFRVPLPLVKHFPKKT